MKKLILIILIFISLNTYSQMSDTDCGYGNCDEVENNDTPSTNIDNSLYILFTIAIILIYKTNKKLWNH